MRNARAFWQTARLTGDHAQNRGQRFVTTGQKARSAVFTANDPVVHAELQFSTDCRIVWRKTALRACCPAMTRFRVAQPGRIADMRRAV
jgi:hypothetical protein